MMSANGIDIKKAKLLIGGTQYGIFTNLEINAEKPKETMTTIGGEIKNRSGSDRFSWSAEGLIPVGSVKDVLNLCKKADAFVIEGETADNSGVTETITLTGAEITSYRLNISENSAFNLSGICDEPK